MLKNVMFIVFAVALMASINAGDYNGITSMNNGHEVIAGGDDGD